MDETRFDIFESLLFLVNARKTIRSIVENSSNLTKMEKSKFSHYIMNEASDYEIIHILMKDEFPKNKYNKIEEKKLFKELKSFVLETNLINKTAKNKIIFEVDSLNDTGINSSLYSCSEFLDQLENKGLSSKKSVLFEEEPKLLKGKSKTKAVEKAAEVVADTQKEIKVNPIAQDLYKAYIWGSGEAEKGVTWAGKKMRSIWKKAFKIADAAGAKTAAGFIYKHKGKVGSTLLVSLITYGGVQTYKKIWSRAAHACSHTVGEEKTRCFTIYKINALRAEIRDLDGSMAACRDSNDVKECQDKIRERIKKIEHRIEKLLNK